MKKDWDTFVAASRNATFLFMRDYMDYHADRFSDYSLIALKHDRIIALLPADITAGESGNVLRSHGGLTYGGWILPPRHFGAEDMLVLFSTLLEYCRHEGISELYYAPLPWIYAGMPSEEDRYALFRLGAGIEVCNLSCVIDLKTDPGFNTQQKRNLKRGLSYDPVITAGADPAIFHTLLSSCLAERHDAVPVHSLSELELLISRFPYNIRLYTCSDSTGVQAGVCIYDTGRVVHCQYIASTRQGRERGLLTVLMHHLITRVYAGRDYFDFGTSNEDGGRILNPGLYRQKSGLGGSGVTYPRYRLTIRPQDQNT